jgi:hypothetical protein
MSSLLLRRPIPRSTHLKFGDQILCWSALTPVMWILLTILQSALPVKYLFRKDLPFYTCFDSKSAAVGNVVKNVSLGQFYLRFFRFSPVGNIFRLLIPHTSEGYRRHPAGVNLGADNSVKHYNSVPVKICFIDVWNVEKLRFYVLVMNFSIVLLLQVRV